MGRRKGQNQRFPLNKYLEKKKSRHSTCLHPCERQKLCCKGREAETTPVEGRI